VSEGVHAPVSLLGDAVILLGFRRRWRSACRWRCRRPRRCCRCCAADGELNTPQGERAFSILLFQDLSIVPLITIIAAMSRNPADRRARRAGSSALYTIAGRRRPGPGRPLPAPARLFRLIGRLGEREMFVVAGCSRSSPARR
jgi:hypothetical protein